MILVCIKTPKLKISTLTHIIKIKFKLMMVKRRKILNNNNFKISLINRSIISNKLKLKQNIIGIMRVASTQ